MNKQISDQELTQMVQSIAEQYAPSPSLKLNFTVKRLLIGLGFLMVFIFFALLLIKQITFSNHPQKNIINPHQVVPFEDPHPTEPPSESAITPPPVIPTTNPVQIPLPPQPSSLMLPLPIPDNHTEIRPLIPPAPLPQPFSINNGQEAIKPNIEPKIEPSTDPDSVPPKDKDLKDTPEEPESVIDIQLSQPDDNI